MKSEWGNCFKCNYQAVTELFHCPRCRKIRLRGATEIRWLGVLLTGIGAILMLMMAAISFVYASLVYAPHAHGSSVRFNGTQSDIVFAFGIFAAVIIVGFFTATAGVWQMIFGRRNRVLLWLGLAAGIVLLVGGEAILPLLQQQ